MLTPIGFNINDIRTHRQYLNNSLAYDSIMNNSLAHINTKELERILNYLEISRTDLYKKCQADVIFCKLLSSSISINASRQGSKDENTQINTCALIGAKCNITIEKLSVVDYRPTKFGEIINNTEFKKRKMDKHDCLKSFDAKITGVINGWLFAKIVIGNGGHQDNVFEETYSICEWILQYGSKDEIFIILIDTNLIDKLNTLILKYRNERNILIGDCVKVQQYFIDNYYESSK